MPQSSVQPASLPIIRLALLAGVLGFGAVTWFVHRGGQLEPLATADSLRLLRTAGAAIWAIATVAELVMFLVVRRTRDAGSLRSRKIVAWAIGESVALFGGVYWFQSGDPRWYVYGLVFFLVTLMLFPSRDMG